MSQIQPDQANFLLHGVYLPGLRNEHQITKSIIKAIPLDKGDYRPDAVSKSALELAWQRARYRGNQHLLLPADHGLVGLNTLQHWLWQRLQTPAASQVAA